MEADQLAKVRSTRLHLLFSQRLLENINNHWRRSRKKTKYLDLFDNNTKTETFFLLLRFESRHYTTSQVENSDILRTPRYVILIRKYKNGYSLVA